MDCYLIEERVISSSYSSPVSLSACVHLDHRLDVVAGQLSSLDNPNADLDIARISKGAEQTEQPFIWVFFEKAPFGLTNTGFSLDKRLLKDVSGPVMGTEI